MIHTLPAVACLRRAWPSSRIRWIVNPEWAPVLAGNPDIDAVVLFPRSEMRGLLGARRILPWARSIRALGTDLALDFQGLLRSALIASASRAPRIAGLSDAREGARFFYDHIAPVTGSQHAVERYLALVASLGIDVSGPPIFRLPAGEQPPGFMLGEPFVLLHPFARGDGKSLSGADARAFCKSLAPLPVVLVGRGGEEFLAPDNVINLMHKTSLSQLIWLIRQARFVVSVDSGPMHIAAALTGQLLSIHTWSDPRRVGPFNPEAWVLKDAVVRRADGAPRSAPDIRAVAGFVREQMAQ